ncbi:hypothetical protein F5146DRAFT_1143188 [Armillaria mellea]|nr:hypothetical protein F5146DRAFT_1143188 [Armillaria mellea]
MELDIYASFSLHISSTLEAGHTRVAMFSDLIKKYAEATEEEYNKEQQAHQAANKKLLQKKLKVWNFPKLHSPKHLFNDIEAKGITLNYNTKPNESMHRSFKESYQ